MRERFGAQDERSMKLRFHTQTGGVTLMAQQPENNIVRVALQAFAAVCGGTQSLHTNGYDEALALPTERAARLALRTQQIIAHESGAADTRRPLRGLVLRRVADRRDRAARARADRARSTSMGGSVNAIAFMKGEIEESAFGYHERYRTGQDIVVGVNKYVTEEARGPGHPQGRPGLRGRAGRAPGGVQGRARPGAWRDRASTSCARPPAARTTCCPASAPR